MAAGVTDRLWEISDIVKVLEDWEAALLIICLGDREWQRRNCRSLSNGKTGASGCWDFGFGLRPGYYNSIWS